MYARQKRTNAIGCGGRDVPTRRQGTHPEKLLRLSAAALASFALITASPASFAHEEEEDDAAPIQEVIGDVGDVSFSTSCKGDGVQAMFDRGVALLHHMTYEVAEREFAKAAKVDPACAMAHWGIALTLIHPVWPGQPSAAVLARGEGELVKARALQKTNREAGYVEALAAFYDDWEVVDHDSRIRRWDEKQTALREKYPNDDDASAIAALIHIAASPKEDLHYRFNRESGALLESLRARRPRHPGAVHYLIHAYDNPPLAAKALAAARSYGSIAPDVPHALHMPSHIFTRLGLWIESVSWNIRSREASRSLVVNGAIYKEFAHASDYMTYAYLQAGRDAEARKAGEILFAAPRIQDDFVAAYAYAAVPARIEMERRDWQRAAQITPRQPEHISWDEYPSCEAVSYFARGIGAARSGQLEVARAAVARLDLLVRASEAQGSAYWAKQTSVQKQAVEAWILYSEGQTQTALAFMQSAADTEDALDKHPVTPGAVLPSRDLYADMLVGEKRFEEALAAYEVTLEISPNRFYSLAGAGRAAEEAGRSAAAHRHYARLVEIAGDGETSRPGLARARAFLSRDLAENQADIAGELGRSAISISF